MHPRTFSTSPVTKSASRRARGLLSCSWAALAFAAGGLGASPAMATCTVAGAPNYACSDANTATIAISATDAAVASRPGFSVITASGNALQITGTGALSYTDTNAATLTAGGNYGLYFMATGDSTNPGSVTVNTTGNITGNGMGIFVQHTGGTGATTITATGTVRGNGTYGIDVTNAATASDIVINAGDVSGNTIGIYTTNSSTTGATRITATGDVAGGTATSSTFGINATNAGTDLTIDVRGKVTSGYDGIVANNNGTGATSITVGGTVSGESLYGIYAQNTSAATGAITISAATDVSGGNMGVYVVNQGHGAASITAAAGTITGTNYGIRATGTSTTTDMTIDVVNVTGTNTSGILVGNSGTGATRITASGDVTGGTATSGTAGISATNAGTDLVIVAGGAVSAGFNGIAATNSGTGVTMITANGTVSGGAQYGLYAQNTPVAAGEVTISAAADVTGGNIGINANNQGHGATNVYASAGTITGANYGVRATGTASTTDMTINVVNATGTSTTGIFASNSGTGGTYVTASGAVTGGTAATGTYGIQATNAGTDLMISAESAVSAGLDAISATNNGTGVTSVTTSGLVNGAARYGIYAQSSTAATGDVTVKAIGDVTGGTMGIVTLNQGHAATNITAIGTVSGATYGIRATPGATATDLVISAANVSATGNSSAAISALNSGTGTTSITTTGVVTGGAASSGTYGINASNAGTGLTIDAQGNVSAGFDGIVTNNTGTGATSITTASGTVVNGGSGFGINATAGATTTGSLTITTGGTVSGGTDGIAATNHGAGDVRVQTAGAVTGTSQYAIRVLSDGTGAATVVADGDVTSGSYAIYVSTANNAPIGITTNAITKTIAGAPSDLAIFGSGGPLTLNNSGTLTGRVAATNTDSNIFTNTGTWNTAGSGTDNSEEGLTSVVNSGAINFQQATGTDTFAAPISSTGTVTKTGAGTTILTGANTYTGGTTITGGTLQLGDGGSSGSITGAVTDNAALVFNRSDDWTLDATITGTGSVSQIGTGTTTLTATNSYTGGTSITAGTLAVDPSSSVSTTSLGTGGVDIGPGGTLAATTNGAFTLDNALTGTGRVTASNSGAAFDFDAGAGSAFAGTVALSNDSFALGGVNTTALTNATLVVGTDNVTTVADGNQHIGGLTINGGTMIFDAIAPLETVADSLVTTGTLDVAGTGIVRINVPNPYEPPLPAPLTVLPAADVPSLFEQSHVVTGLQLVAATGLVTGSAAGLTLEDQNGEVITDAEHVNVSEGGNLVAVGTWNYGLGVGANKDGLYVGYSLTVLDIQPNQTLTLTEAPGASGDAADMAAKITGTGDLVIDANNLISLSNPTNDFTGTTTVTRGTLQAQAPGIIATSGAVTLDAGTTFDTNGFDQSLNNLSGAADSRILLSGNDTLTLHVGAAAAPAPAVFALSLGNDTLTPTADALPTDFAGLISGDGALILATGTQILSGANTYTGGTTIDAGATLQLGNGGAGGSITGDVTDNGTLAFDRSDEASFDAVITGTGGVSQIGTGSTTLTGANTYAGPTSVLAGTLYIDGDQSGAVGLTSVAEGATLGGIGIIGGSVTNTGTVAPGHSAQMGTLTINGNYAGNGGTLLIRTVLGDDNSATDRLVVGGDTSGTTLVSVVNQGGAGAQTVNGIEIVRVTGASDGVFTLKSDYLFQGEPAVVAGAYAYRLYKNGVSTPDDGGWYLRSTLTESGGGGSDGGSGGGGNGGGGNGGGGSGGGDTGGGSGGGDNGGGSGGGGDSGGGSGDGDNGSDGGTTTPPQPPSSNQPTVPPLYQPGVPVYENYPQTLLALNTLPTLQQRVGNRSWSGGAVDGGGIWGRIEGQRQRPDVTLSTGLSDRRTNLWQAQIGFDRVVARRGDGATLIAGITGQYGKADTSVTSIFGDGAIKTDGYGLGATLTWYGPHGFYADAQGKFSWYGSDLGSSVLGRLIDNNRGTGKAFSLELGKRVAVGGHLSLTPQVQTVYSKVDFDAFTDPHGTDVRLGRADSLRTRWGLSLDRDAGGTHVYAVANILHEWLDGSRVDVSGTPIDNRSRRFIGEFGVGGSTALRGGRVVLYANASAATPLADFAHAATLSGVVGIRVGF